MPYKLTITRNFDIGTDQESRKRTAPVLKELYDAGKLLEIKRTEISPYPNDQGHYSYYRLFDSEASAKDYLEHCFDDDKTHYDSPTIVSHKIEPATAS